MAGQGPDVPAADSWIPIGRGREEADVGKREHLFISYAWEDGALAEWLTMKLTAEGYLVWCDRFKILGGERWPDDIDAAIREKTFRMLHLVSKHSLRKPNPTKERELALQLEKERGDELLIPLNVDGTRSSELPWRIVDVAFIPFHEWQPGFTRLLKKLNSVNAPRPLTGRGRGLAASAYAVRSTVVERAEDLITNLFPFTSVPRTITRFRFLREIGPAEASRMHKVWAFKNLGHRAALAFAAPPLAVTSSLNVEEEGRVQWHKGQTVEGIRGEHLVTELLGKSLDVHCHAKGLVEDPGNRGFYFPPGLLPKETLFFNGYRGVRTRVRVCGFRTFGGRRCRYHLGPWFRVRYEPDYGYVAQLRLRVHVTDCHGEAIDARAALARRKRIGGSWWNGGWLNRQFAVMSYLADEQAQLRIGEELESQVVLSASPVLASVNRGINEALLQSIGAPLGLLEADADAEPEGDE